MLVALVVFVRIAATAPGLAVYSNDLLIVFAGHLALSAALAAIHW
jgi:hypothetical protein